MDRMTPEQRHLCMSHIRGKDTGPEWAVRRMVHAMGFRYRLHVSGLPGKPDLVLPRHRKIIFVHGCFWHAHGCLPSRKAPATHPRFWTEKFARNVARDRNVLGQLWSAGWHTLVVWECETKDPGRLHAILAAFLKPSRGPANYALDDQHALYEQAAESRVEYGVENES
jgi:DNA mismatch endonuclease (patch repair protein)